MKNSTADDKNDVNETGTAESSEDVALSDRMTALEQQVVELQTMRQRVEVLEDQVWSLQKELARVTSESEEVILPLEDDGSKVSASETTAQEIRSGQVAENREGSWQEECHGCNRRETLSKCANCKKRFCKTCQFWCSKKLWGCGLKLCDSCNKDSPKAQHIYKDNNGWYCGKCHIKWDA